MVPSFVLVYDVELGWKKAKICGDRLKDQNLMMFLILSVFIPSLEN